MYNTTYQQSSYIHTYFGWGGRVINFVEPKIYRMHWNQCLRVVLPILIMNEFHGRLQSIEQIPSFQITLCKLRRYWLLWNMNKSLNSFFWRTRVLEKERNVTLRRVWKAPRALAFFLSEQSLNEACNYWHGLYRLPWKEFLSRVKCWANSCKLSEHILVISIGGCDLLSLISWLFFFQKFLLWIFMLRLHLVTEFPLCWNYASP